jgi:hypothetical protein
MCTRVHDGALPSTATSFLTVADMDLPRIRFNLYKLKSITIPTWGGANGEPVLTLLVHHPQLRGVTLLVELGLNVLF